MADYIPLGAFAHGHCSVNASVKSKTYCFGNEQAKTDFMKDPKGNLAKAQSYYSTKSPG